MNESSPQPKSFSEIQEILCEETYYVEGIGDVKFPVGVYQVEANAEIDLEENFEEDFSTISEAASAAVSAVKDSYSPEIAEKILAKFNASLFPSPGKSKSIIPVTVIRSRDFFQNRITVIPRPELLNILSDFTDKLKAIDFIKKNPLALSGVSQIEKSTSLTVEEIKSKLQESGITDEEIQKIEDKSELIDAIEQKNYTLLVDSDSLSDIESLIVEENSFLENAKKESSANVYQCEIPDTSPSPFLTEEVSVVAEQCCEPKEELLEQIEVADPEIPDFLTEQEIEEFLSLVELASQEMNKCGQEASDAEVYIQKLRKVKEDLFTLSYFFKERYQALIGYQTTIDSKYELETVLGKIESVIAKMQREAEKIFGTTEVDLKLQSGGIFESGIASEEKIKRAYQTLYSLTEAQPNISNEEEIKRARYTRAIQSYSNEYEKNVSKIQTLQENIKQQEDKLKSSDPLDSVTIQSLKSSVGFSIESFLGREVLYPSEDKNTEKYSNQSGLIKGGQYFLILNEEESIFKELEKMLEMNLFSSTMKNFLVNASDANSSFEKYSKNPVGKFYSEFYEKYNSADRVDFLFSYTEQGYLTPKPSAAELATQAGQEKLKDVKIDENAAFQFLKNYRSLEQLRSVEKISQIKKDSVDFFAQVKRSAISEASRIYQIESFFQSLGLSEKTNTVKKYRETLTQEYETISAFEKEIEKKIETLEKIFSQSQECITIQEQRLTGLAPIEKTEVNQPPGSDPYGARPTSPFSPSTYKRCYWKEYTKCLQTVSFMPIPDIKNLNKRLFRYYPVGMRFPVPVPPGVLPTLASGIPDSQISIPFPILWKLILNLTTPAGTFVLWMTYTAPFTFSPYLLYFADDMSSAFLITPRGPVDVPAPSLKWQEGGILSKSLLQRIPGLRIPMKKLPTVDSSVNNKNADDKLRAIQELRNRIKSKIDSLDSNISTLSEKRIKDRTKLRSYREKIKSKLNLENGQIDLVAVKDMLGEVKKIVKRKTVEMIDFEPFTVPMTQKKRVQSLEPLEDFKKQISKVKDLARNGVKLDVKGKTVDVEKILKSKATGILDTQEGRIAIQRLQEKLDNLNEKLAKEKKFDAKLVSEERAKVIISELKTVLESAAKKITPKTLGFIAAPIALFPAFLPFPCKSDLPVLAAPAWIGIAIGAIQKSIDLLNSSEFENKFARELSVSIGISGPSLPSAKDLLYQSISTSVDKILNLVPPVIPGWPSQISYPTSVSLLTQNLKELENSIWKIKFKVELGGIPPIPITADLIKSIANPAVDIAIDLVFSQLLEELNNLPNELNDQKAIIKLKAVLQTLVAVFGNDLWDVNEQDLKILSSAFVRDALIKVDEYMEKILGTIDLVKKDSKSFFEKIAKFSKQNIKKSLAEAKNAAQKDDAYLDIGTEIASALFKSFTAKYLNGDLPSPPFPVTLLACSTGFPGWLVMTSVNPFSAIEKIPAYERMSLKNVPFVIFLDMIAASAQRKGGIGSDYVIPYTTLEV